MAKSNIVIADLVVTSGVGQLVLEWPIGVDASEKRGLPNLALQAYEVWRATTNNRAFATKIADVAGATQYIDKGLPKNTTRFYWVVARDISQNKGDFFPFSATAGKSAKTSNLQGNADVANLSDITPSIGETTAGTVTSALVRSAASGSRFELRSSDQRLVFIDASSGPGKERVSIGLTKASGDDILDAPFYMNVADGDDNGAVFINHDGVAIYGRTDNNRLAAIVGEAYTGNQTKAGAFYNQTSGGGQAQLGRTAAQGGWAFYALVGDYGPFTGAHDALIAIEANIAVGDIVVDLRVLARKGMSDAVTEVARSTLTAQRGVVGVATRRSEMSDEMSLAALPPPVNGEDVTWLYRQLQARFDHLTINSVGEGQMNVCGRGGTIEVGDFICASDLPGKGQLQRNADGVADDLLRRCTVAKARETVSFDNPDQVKTIAVIYLCG